MTVGRKSHVGTEKEKIQKQVRLIIQEVEVLKKNNYFGFGDLSKYIVNLWDKDFIKRGLK